MSYPLHGDIADMTIDELLALRDNWIDRAEEVTTPSVVNFCRTRIEDINYELELIASQIDEIMNEEQDAFDNMPEGPQQCDRGQAMEAGIGESQDAIDSLSSAFQNLESAQGE